MIYKQPEGYKFNKIIFLCIQKQYCYEKYISTDILFELDTTQNSLCQYNNTTAVRYRYRTAVVLKFVCVSGEDDLILQVFQEFFMQFRGGTENAVCRKIVFVMVVGHDGTCFTGNDRSGSDVIFLQGKFPVTVQSA